MTRPLQSRSSPWLAAVVAGLMLGASARAATPAELEAGYTAAAGVPADAARGQHFFTSAHGAEWRCSSCHGERPVQPGSHAATGKAIAPLAPAAQPTRFTDAAKTEKWFKRNCQDVLGRACTPGEKADVILWLRGLQP